MSVDRSGDGLVTAVPEYVHYVVLELLKNAMRATMQTHSKGGDSPMAAAAAVDDAPGAEGRVKGKKAPAARERGGGGGDKQEKKGSRLNAPIVFSDVPELVISIRAKGEEDVELVVADQGGGIENEATDKVRTKLLIVGLPGSGEMGGVNSCVVEERLADKHQYYIALLRKIPFKVHFGKRGYVEGAWSIKRCWWPTSKVAWTSCVS